MTFIMLDSEQKNKYSDEILEMMQKSDTDFVPPLSARYSTIQNDWQLDRGNSCACGIEEYHKSVMQQKILVAASEGTLVGFVSFIEDIQLEKTVNINMPNIYISTIILNKEKRGEGIVTKMYKHLFMEVYKEKNIFTRTWSGNEAHTKILNRFGFEEVYRKINDRGDGVDTVYYELKR